MPSNRKILISVFIIILLLVATMFVFKRYAINIPAIQKVSQKSSKEITKPLLIKTGKRVLPSGVNSFNFVDPEKDFYGHLRMDVKPWIEWGVSIEDPTTKKERIQMLTKTELGRQAMDYLGYKY